MWLSLKQGSLQLKRDSPLAFRQASGYWVCCVDGHLWLTITGQPGDHLLAAGDRVRIDSNGLAVISGLPAGTLRLHRDASWPVRSATGFCNVRAVFGCGRPIGSALLGFR